MIPIKTMRSTVFEAVMANPGLSYTELQKVLPGQRIAHPLFILYRQNKLTRQRVKRLPNPYTGVWIYFVRSNQQRAA